VSRKAICWALRKKGIMEPEMRAGMEMYREAEKAVLFEGTKTASFEVKVVVH